MGGEVIIVALIFGTIFGVYYLHYSTRNKERLALIDKGADASIFNQGRRSGVPMWKILILNLALLLVGIGLAIFIAALLSDVLGMDEDVAYPGTILVMAGLGLFAGFNLTKRLEGSN
ncbi:MAG: hypothetical protein OEQ81_06210 [Flavobacteriaceae bacterium]|nr:hypothetical protein [Flavobacteriaceae bacterium]